MGKLGGEELNYSSDVDLVYVYERPPESSGGERGTAGGRALRTRLAEIVTRTLSEVTGDGFVFRVDLRLRPEGQNGPIVNSLGGAITYYESLGPDLGARGDAEGASDRRRPRPRPPSSTRSRPSSTAASSTSTRSRTSRR